MGTFSGTYTQSITNHVWLVFDAAAGDPITINVDTRFRGRGCTVFLYRAPDGRADIGDRYSNGSLELVQVEGFGFDTYNFTYRASTAGQFALQLDSYTGGSGIYTVSISGSTATSLYTSAVMGSPLCAGATLNIPFTAPGQAFNEDNIFTAQLSDAFGSFAAPVTIGTASGTASGTVSGIIPAATPAGSGYRIRLISSSPAVTGIDNGRDLQVDAPSVVTAPATLVVPTEMDECTASVAFAANATNGATLTYLLGSQIITSPYRFRVG